MHKIGIGIIMELKTLSEIYQLISKAMEKNSVRNNTMILRKRSLIASFAETAPTLKKVAFDTRRVDQENTYISRRGLQNYHRSEKFISDKLSQQIEAFTKLSKILDTLKQQYSKNYEWNDSYTRILHSATHKALRTLEKDDDFSDAQPSVGNLTYLEELMYLRYRLTIDDLLNMSDENLKKAILDKDEFLTRNFTPEEVTITPTDINNNNYQDMFNKMMALMTQAFQQQQQQSLKIEGVEKKLEVKHGNSEEKVINITIKV